MHCILIAGCGNIGSRHLQSLKSLENPCLIYAYDPFQPSLDKAKSIWESTKGTDHAIHFTNSLDNIPKHIFLAIIATNSSERLNVLVNIYQNYLIDHLILEKFLFPNTDDYLNAQKIIDTKSTTVHVNCPRRVFEPYIQFKTDLAEVVKSIRLEGNNWGLCSNTIHFLDLFNFISTKKPLSAKFNSNAKIVPSKREGYIEVFGSLMCNFDGFISEIICNEGEFSGIEIQIETNDSHYRIEEKNNQITIFKNNTQVISGKMKFQSELSSTYVQKLMKEQPLGLTSFSDSRQMHEVFLSAVQVLTNQNKYSAAWKIS